VKISLLCSQPPPSYRFVVDMDSAPNNLSTQGNAGDENEQPNDERNGQENAGQAGGKEKGKRKVNTAELEEEEEEEVERRQKAMLQRHEEAFAKLEADIDADGEVIRAAERHHATLKERLMHLRLVPEDDLTGFDEVVEPLYPPIEFVRSESGSGPAGDENKPVSEAPSPRDPNEGASQ
jgi:hypothetical protein